MKLRERQRQIRQPGVKTAAIYAAYINILIYLLFAVMIIYGRSAVIPYEESHPHPIPSVWMIVFGFITSYIYVFLLLWINFAILKSGKRRGSVRTVVAIAVSLTLVIAWNQLMHLVQQGIFNIPPPDVKVALGSFFRDLLLGGMVVFISQIMYINYRRQQVMVENEALKAEYERARYETLKSQIDPHFLFNTLNTLNAVISLDQQKAQQYVQKLSAIFRYTIQTRDVTTLSEEIGFTKDYCDLMRIRFGENLSFAFDIAPEYNHYLMVPFGIQTLVENAIKHNVITNRQPLTVSIYTQPDGYVVVSNPVNPRSEPDPGEGIGLANLSERYRLKWNRDVEISADDAVFSVRLPLVREQSNS